MSAKNPTVSDAVVDLVSRNYAIFECLRIGLINYHALASKLKPSVDKIVGKDVNIGAVVMAIKRFSDSQGKIRLPPSVSLLRDAKMTLTIGNVVLTITPKKEGILNVSKKVAELSSQLSEPVTIFPFVRSIKIVADKKDYGKLEAKLNDDYSLKLRRSAAKLTLYLAEEAEKTPGIAAYITDVLYRNGINIIDALLGSDVVLILDEADASRAFTVLEEQIRSK